jgi:hypothetical protein
MQYKITFAGFGIIFSFMAVSLVMKIRQKAEKDKRFTAHFFLVLGFKALQVKGKNFLRKNELFKCCYLLRYTHCSLLHFASKAFTQVFFYPAMNKINKGC